MIELILDEGIDLNKTSNSRECWLCHLCQKYYCNGCHDMSMKAVCIIYSKRNIYGVHFRYMNKHDTISIMNNSNLIDKKGVL